MFTGTHTVFKVVWRWCWYCDCRHTCTNK